MSAMPLPARLEAGEVGALQAHGRRVHRRAKRFQHALEDEQRLLVGDGAHAVGLGAAERPGDADGEVVFLARRAVVAGATGAQAVFPAPSAGEHTVRDVVTDGASQAESAEVVFHVKPLEMKSGDRLRLEAKELEGPLSWTVFDADAFTEIKGPGLMGDQRCQFTRSYASVSEKGEVSALRPGDVTVLAMDRMFNKEMFGIKIS